MSYICETCGEETSVVQDDFDAEPVSTCCGDFVLDGSWRLTLQEYNDHNECNEADWKNRDEKEGKE